MIDFFQKIFFCFELHYCLFKSSALNSTSNFVRSKFWNPNLYKTNAKTNAKLSTLQTEKRKNYERSTLKRRTFLNLLYSPAFADKFANFSFDKWNRVADDFNEGQKNYETFLRKHKKKNNIFGQFIIQISLCL